MKPERNAILKAECLEFMRSLDDQSVDLVLGSPPYENARSYGELEFNLAGERWVAWMAMLWVEMQRISRGLVAMVVEGRTQNYRYSATPLLLAADLHRSGFNLRKPPIYHRVGIPGSGGPDWLRNDYEFVICTTRPGKLPWSDNTACGHEPKFGPGGSPSHRIRNGERVGCKSTDRRPNGELKPRQYKPPAKANPGNIIDCGAGGGAHLGHPLAHENEAPYPELLAEFFVKSFCPPGGLVYDPFCGSGTTAAVALKTGRDFLTTDVRQSQVEIARRRVADVKSQMEVRA